MKRFYNPFILSALFALCYLNVLAQDAVPSAAPKVKTFATASDVTGLAAKSVNLFTGSVAFPVKLISVPGNKGLDLNLSIDYNSAVREAANTWNRESPAGILGLGWSLDMPRIIVDHKQTGNKDDDDYYLVEGGTTLPLVRTISGSDGSGSYYVYQAKNYQYWSIKYYYDINERIGAGLISGSNKWVITKEDGTRYVYGEHNNSRNTVQYLVRWSNWIGSSSATTGQTQMVHIWNLSEVINPYNEKLTFKYDVVEQFVGGAAGKKHTEASYISEIADGFGRKLKFYYAAKASQFYTEPHTEQAEPDAYQENYEKNYLDKVELLLASGSVFLTVQFAYKTTGEPLNKMRLSSITQKNAAGQSLPAMSFVYNETAGPTLGYLTTVTYPTGSSVAYTYTATTLGYSNRELTATAPSGYAEPKAYVGDDYVLVIWRQLGTGGTHDLAARPIKAYAYRWLGRWVEKEVITSTGYVKLTGDQYKREYDNLQVATEKDFFAVMIYQTDGSTYVIRCAKSDIEIGGWSISTDGRNFGAGTTPTLLSGDKFVAVGSFQDDTQPSALYFYQGGINWKYQEWNQTLGDHFYGATNNYIISQKRDATGSARSIQFVYLSEDKKWGTKTLNTAYTYSSTDPSYWYAGSAMALVMADDNPEYVYRWDLTYTNFYRDYQDKNSADLFGQLPDDSKVFFINNSMIGADSKIARFDGVGWSSKSLITGDMSFKEHFSYGEDYMISPSYIGSNGTVQGKLRIYDPNTMSFGTDIGLTGDFPYEERSTAANDYFFFGSSYFYRGTNGTWTKVLTYPQMVNDEARLSAYPNFDVWHQVGTNIYHATKIRRAKNGQFSDLTFNGRRILYHPYKFKSHGVSNQTIVSVPTSFASHEDATSITLNRMVNGEITGSQIDYPVTLLTVWDGHKFIYTTIRYNAALATTDPNGITGRYHEVSVVPGSSVPTYYPMGYTKTLFYNGLTTTELGLTPAYLSVDTRWTGSAFSVSEHNNVNAIIKNEKTEFSAYATMVKNDENNQVAFVNHVRPTKVTTTLDNKKTETTYAYQDGSGLPHTKTVDSYLSSSTTSYITTYKYFYQEYDVNKTLNLLTPVIQETTYLNNPSGQQIIGVNASTWKQWNGVYSPHKSYQWKRTGSEVFDFTNWSGSNEPAANWIKVGEVNEVDAKGNILQMTTR